MSAESSSADSDDRGSDTPGVEPIAAEMYPTRAHTEVLGNLDILEEIFSFIFQPRYPEELETIGRISFPSSSHLVSASLVQKSFFEPAMNVLWRSMNSLEPVLLLIPTLALTDGVYATLGWRKIRGPDLDRLKSYTRRVRNFCFTPPEGVISPELIYTLSTKLGGPLFPALRELSNHDIDLVPVDKRQAMFLLASSTLSKLRIMCRDNDMSSSTVPLSASWLELLIEAAEVLTSLELDGPIACSAFAANITEVIARHACTLKQVILSNPPTWTQPSILPSLRSLSRAFSLTELTIHFGEDAAFSGLYSLGRPTPLTALESLRISGPEQVLLCVFEHHITCPGLTGLSINILPVQQRAEQGEALNHCIGRLLQLTCTSLLRSIEVGLLWLHIAWHISEALPVLLTCTLLSEVEMTYNMDDQGIQTLYKTCSGLPLLEVLKISWMIDRDEGVHFTLLQLEDLARRRPSLRVIEFFWIFAHGPSEFKTMQERTMKKPLNHKLETLRVSSVQATARQANDDAHQGFWKSTRNAIMISRYIDHLFPFLRVLEIFPIDDVELMVKAYQEVRKLAKEVDEEPE